MYTHVSTLGHKRIRSLLTKILSKFLVQTCWVLESNYCVHASGDMNGGGGGGGEDPHEKGEEEEDEDLTI